MFQNCLNRKDYNVFDGLLYFREIQKTNFALIISTLICLLFFFVAVIDRQGFVYLLCEVKLQYALFVLRSKWINLLFKWNKLIFASIDDTSSEYFFFLFV